MGAREMGNVFAMTGRGRDKVNNGSGEKSGGGMCELKGLSTVSRTSCARLLSFKAALRAHLAHVAIDQARWLPKSSARDVESDWCLDMISTHGAWRHAEVEFFLPGVCFRPQ